MSKKAPRPFMLYSIAIIGFIFALHVAIPMYSNSSFLSLFANEQLIGIIYMAGAALGILGFLIAPSIIRRIGNYMMAMILICMQMALFFGLISSTSPSTLAILFILQSGVVSLIGLTLDIFLEVYTTDGEKTGSIRGFYTATLNASWVIAPLIGSLLINKTNNYQYTYVAALAMLFPLLYLIYRNFPKFKDPNYTKLSITQLAKHISSNKNWVKLFSANIILQTFYSWMIIYSPIYLHNNIGFSWEEIGIILVIMLLPFPLIQYPLGKLADEKYGEQEIMTVGFAIVGISTIMLSYFTLKSVLLWSILLFITRIGAASAEIMMETYFFKTVSARDTAVLGSYRITRPLSYFIAPIIMIVGLWFVSEQNMFIIIGLFSLLALYPALTIEDTK